MNDFEMAATVPPIVKLASLMGSRRIFKPRVQTIFEDVAKITPQFIKAAAASPAAQMRALSLANPLLAGRL